MDVVNSDAKATAHPLDVGDFVEVRQGGCAGKLKRWVLAIVREKHDKAFLVECLVGSFDDGQSKKILHWFTKGTAWRT